MRIVGGALLCLWLAHPASAQVTVELLLEQQQFLRYESLPVTVRIINRSGQTIHLGKEPDWLSFTVESRDGVTVPKFGEVPVDGEFSLDSALLADRPVDLMPHFDLSLPGRYRVSATLKIKAWNEEVSSRPKDFEIVRGTRIWEQEFGVPTTNGPPEVRKYVLQQATSMKQLRLYARVSDAPENRIFRITLLGPLVSFSRPEAQLDRESQLHVLFQTGARSFNYSIIDPEGQVIARQTHDYTATRPVLQPGKDGNVMVRGGARRFAKDDLPPSPPEGLTNRVNAASPTSVTNPVGGASPAKTGKENKSKKAKKARAETRGKLQ